MEIEESKINSVFDLLYKQYEEERIKYFLKHNKVSNYDSENLIYYLLKEVVSKYENIDFVFRHPLNIIINDKSLLNDEELKYCNNSNTHIDFLIYDIISKKPVLAIEVDGYNYHKEGTKQYDRDKIKNRILNKYNIPFIRLKTNQSKEKEKIENKLNMIYKIKVLKNKYGKIENL